jgi:hypothetical protein
MKDDKRSALMEQAARYRDDAARAAGRAFVPIWDCGRGHEWDDTLDHAQNVRCMNCASQRREIEMRRLRDLAEARGGALASADYVDASTPLAWRCARGHRWEARAHDAQRRWCAECARMVFAAYR